MSEELARGLAAGVLASTWNKGRLTRGSTITAWLPSAMILQPS